MPETVNTSNHSRCCAADDLQSSLNLSYPNAYWKLQVKNPIKLLCKTPYIAGGKTAGLLEVRKSFRLYTLLTPFSPFYYNSKKINRHVPTHYTA